MAQIWDALSGSGWEARADRECTSKGGRECSDKRPQMWNLSPCGDLFPGDFTWSFVINFTVPQREESQTWYRAASTQPPPMDPQLGLQTMENSAGNLRKTLENSCTPQNSYENAAGIIPISLQDKPLWKIKSERALSLPSFGSPLLSKWKKTPTLVPLSCQMDMFNRKTMEKECFLCLVLPLSIVTS